MNGLKSRSFAIGIILLLVAAFLAYSFWPRAILVDMARAETGLMRVTINEEGKTQIHDRYIVSAPVAGRLLRTQADPGDKVIAGQTVIVRMVPSTPSALDVRSEEQARSAIKTAEAALALAKAERQKAAATADFARGEYHRVRTLWQEGIVADSALERARQATDAATASLEMTAAAIGMREAQAASANAMLISFAQAHNQALSSEKPMQNIIQLSAPTDGLVLRIFQENETFIAVGSPILEIGDPAGDLEVIAELLSTQAVKVQPGDSVIIEDWGGAEPLQGVVETIEPWGFTKFSALGVEEQRVKIIIGLIDLAASSNDSIAAQLLASATPTRSAPDKSRLGHGFRVQVRIIVWEKPDALSIPASAVFRDGRDWVLYKVVDGHARQQVITIGQSNGLNIEIIDGLSSGDQIILYPGDKVFDGIRVRPRTSR